MSSLSAVVMAGRGRSATPLPGSLMQLIRRIEVIQNAEGQSGFRLTFAGKRGRDDFAALSAGRLDLFNRVIIMVAQGSLPVVLIDGVVTDQWLGVDARSDGEVVVSGADVSAMMDLEQQAAAHPGQNESAIAIKLIARYASWGLMPDVKRPSGQQTPTPSQRIPMQRGSDLEYLYEMADRFGYVFKVSPGPTPLTNVAYWGPPVTRGAQCRTLTVAYGGLGNVEQLAFSYDGLAARQVKGDIQDPDTNKPRKIDVRTSTLPPLARSTPFSAGGKIRKTLLNGVDGQAYAQAQAKAQGEVNLSSTAVVTAEGEVNGLVYGDILRAAAPVGVRGAGSSFDGLYAVEQVSHVLAPGYHQQRFRLRRDGVGSRQPVLRP